MRPNAGAAPAMRFVEVDELLSCVHCGLCQSACPTYVELGTEADSPRGRIHLMRAMEEGRLEPSPEVVRHLDLCLGCRACETACPSGVRYGRLVEATRPFVERHRPFPARAAAETEIQMAHDLGRWLEASLLHRPHEMDAAAWRVCFRAELDVGRAGGLAETAVHAGEELVDVDEAHRRRGSDVRPHRARPSHLASELANA